MAETTTVKKTRIVSEEDGNKECCDDLEEALMEEFNLRLKNCMSQDDLNHHQERAEERNGQPSSADFIQIEKDNYYDEPRKLANHQSNNGFDNDDERIYENVQKHHQNTHKTDPDQYVDMTMKEEEQVHYENVQNEREDGVYEDIADEEEPGVPKTLLNLCEDGEAVEVKSVKDRMFLSTEATDCLLFTQTVTSPMLTPSEENIDFLKGFRRESQNEEVKEKEVENIYENSEFLQHEIIYENLKPAVESSSNEDETSSDPIYQNVDPAGTKEVEETDDLPPKIVESLKFQFLKSESHENRTVHVESQLKSVDIMKQINKFEKNEEDNTTQVTASETYVEQTKIESSDNNNKALCKKKKSKKSRKEEKENISVNGTNTKINNSECQESHFYNVNVKSLCRSFGDLTKIERSDDQKKVQKNGHETSNRTKSSFSKFDALQKKNVLHVRSSDSSKAQEKFNGAHVDNSNCKACERAVFQMEQIKAEKAIWHKNCFRCKECNKQLTVDTYQSHEGTLYCKPHFKALFAPKAVEDDVPTSDKPDLGLEELQSLNVKERFQVFEHHQTEMNDVERTTSAVNVKRSPSILSKLARFQAKGMDIGVPDESLNGIPIEESSSEGDEEDDEVNGDDADLIRAKRVQKEKPFHFTGMSDVKSKWEHGEQNSKDERREERKQEIQSIRNRLFMGKQGKMKEAYQQAVMESESCTNLRKEKIEVTDTKSLKERFEKGDVVREGEDNKSDEDIEVFESEISKKSRSLFLELDANASKAPQVAPPVVTPKLDVKKAREAYMTKKTSSEDVVKSSSDQVGEIEVRTAEIQQKFKFFETYKEPEREKKAFRITPPRDGQVKVPTPDREVYRDPEIVRSEEYIEDSVVAKESHTATKMLNKFRQMEENLSKEPVSQGPKPLKRFTPPPEPARPEESSEDESGSEGSEDEEENEVDGGKMPDEDLLEAQKAARAKQLRAKFERWEANEIKREQNNSTINIIEEMGDEQSQVESTKSLRARFESMKQTNNESSKTPRVKVNRFVEIPNIIESCESCNSRVYPLEKISVHGQVYHKSCFKCMECSCVLRMDSYSYNQGLLYCTPHFKRLFISKGNYDTGFGLDQHKERRNNANIM